MYPKPRFSFIEDLNGNMNLKVPILITNKPKRLAGNPRRVQRKWGLLVYIYCQCFQFSLCSQFHGQLQI